MIYVVEKEETVTTVFEVEAESENEAIQETIIGDRPRYIEHTETISYFCSKKNE